jgi:hypothetical protein
MRKYGQPKLLKKARNEKEVVELEITEGADELTGLAKLSLVSVCGLG